MVQFHPDGKLAFVVSSFTPTVDVIDVASHQVVKRIAVTSPFSPFLQFTPDFREVWMTHKDVGKVTRIDTRTLEVSGVIDTGFITNHLAFASVAGQVRAYVTIGGENLVKVYSTGRDARLLATIPTGALPHGIWSADDGSRLYVGLENGDGVQVIDPASNQVVAGMPGGQAPQALVYLSRVAASGDDHPNLAPRVNQDAHNIRLQAAAGADGRGFVVVRNLGVIDALEVSLFKLKPDTVYSVYLSSQAAPVASYRTDAKGAANGTMIGPVRQAARTDAAGAADRILIMEGAQPPNAATAVLASM
jgi:YVTN family beta-propeller protein